MFSNGISDTMTASVNPEKTCLKKLMMMMKMIIIIIIIIIINISQEMTFLWVPDIDFRYESKARKVMVDFKFDALYR